MLTQDCAQFSCGNNLVRFNTAKSSTYINTTQEHKNFYGGGEINGYISYDVVGIHGGQINKQEFNAVFAANMGANLQGILGLGRLSTFLSNLVTQVHYIYIYI